MMPSKQEILEKATTLFMKDNHGAGYGETLPEEHELKEEGYFDKARQELMCNEYAQDPDVVQEAYSKILELDKMQGENDKLQGEVEKLNRKLLELEQSKLVPTPQSCEQSIQHSREIPGTDTKHEPAQTQTAILKRGHCLDCSSWRCSLIAMTGPMPFRSASYGHCFVSNYPTQKDSSCRAWKPINNGNTLKV